MNKSEQPARMSGQCGPLVLPIGDSWGQPSDADSLATLSGALDAGCNFIDTAACYPSGTPEERRDRRPALGSGRKLLLAWFGLSAWLVLPGFSADYLLKTWRTDDGLADTKVTAIQQTRDGYLWIGTPVALSRFDGMRFVHFTEATLPELGSSPISKLFEDREGTFWIALESGRLVARRREQTRIPLGEAAVGAGIVSMAQGSSGPLWLQTADGRLGRLTASSVEFVAQTGPVTRRTNLGLAVDEKETLWVGTRGGLRMWENDRLSLPAGMEALEGLPVDAIAPASAGGVWVYAGHKLWRIRDRGIASEREGPARLTGSAVAMVEAFAQKPWLAAEGGRLYYLDATDTWQVVTSEMGLRNTNLALYQDREGNLWRGSQGGGLTRLRPGFFRLYERPATDPDRRALSVSSDSAGTVWALLNSRALASLSPGESTLAFWGTRQSTTTVRVLFSDRRGEVWIGSPQKMVYRLHEGVLMPAFVVDQAANGINAFFEDREGNLWVGFSGGAGVGFMPGGSFEEWRTVPGIPLNEGCAIGQAVDGAMWFGTSRGGVCRWHEEKWSHFTTRDGLSSDVVRCFRMEPDGTVWIGSLKGLTRWRNGALATITAENGLWNESIYHIEEDQKGNFWMSSPGGLFHVRARDLHECADRTRTLVDCTGYNRNDGLAAQECTGGVQPAGAKTPDGRLWFPTVDGLVSVDPGSVVDNPLPPPVLIEEVLVEGLAHPLHPAEPSVTAAAGENRIEFRFTALSLASPEKVRFRYKLEGLDRNWSAVDERRDAIYRFVPPGDYVFRVIASNNSGVWSPGEATVRLSVDPFFWQTPWFKGVTLLTLVGSLIWGVRRWECRKARLLLERIEREHAIERERARIAKDIHDDLGASLTQITYLSERLDGNLHDTAEIDLWNKRIQHTARRTIESLDEIVWAISPHHDTLESLANYLGRFAQEHLKLAHISCRLDIPTVLPLISLRAEVRHNLLLATREALQNIVVHAVAREASVALEMRPEALVVRIRDDGRGLDGSRNGEGGNGLANMRQRLEEIGGEFALQSQPGAGTEIRFTVPRSRLSSDFDAGTTLRQAGTGNSPNAT